MRTESVIEDSLMDGAVPIQYRRGYERFMGMDIKVDPRVLIPRPETELLAEKVIDWIKRERLADVPEPVILDLCTGSGAIALAVARTIDEARVIASDVSPDALCVAALNKELFDANGNVEFVLSDIFSALSNGYEGKFDAIVSNPPYVSRKDYEKVDDWVRQEPKVALLAGEEGLDLLEKIIPESRVFLKDGGMLAVEVGYDQSEKVKKIFLENSFAGVTGYFDINGHERVIAGWKNG